MCDYSIKVEKTRPAVVGDELVVKGFGLGTRGFAPLSDKDALGPYSTAVCLLPGTELAFEEDVKQHWSAYPYSTLPEHKVAIFRQTSKDQPYAHHDQLEFPDGSQLLLTQLAEGQRATVLQLPALPKTEVEVEEQRRVEYSG